MSRSANEFLLSCLSWVNSGERPLCVQWPRLLTSHGGKNLRVIRVRDVMVALGTREEEKRKEEEEENKRRTAR